MIYKIEDLLLHAGSDRSITDEGGSLTYSSLANAVRDLEHLLGGQRLCCIHLPVRNRSAHVVALLYLLARKINFFLTAETAAQQTPPFCDAILESVDGRW